MDLFKLIGGGVDEIIDSVGNALDKIFTNDEERAKAKNELAKIHQEAKIKSFQMANAYEQTISRRWLSDNEHALTRLVRPLMALFLYVLFAAIVLADGNLWGFKVNPAYIPVLQTLLVTVTVAYVGSRGAEKITRILKNE